MKVTGKFVGLKAFDAALGEFSRATAKNILERSLLKAATPMHETAVDLAPELSGVLKRKVRMTTAKPKGHSTKVAFAAAKAGGYDDATAARVQRDYNRANGSTLAEVFIGVEDGVAQAWPQEVGTARHGPQPYIRPAFDQHKDEILPALAQELRPEIDKAAARARRRALKKAAKG